MKIIYNKYFPINPFWATNVFGIIFCRIDKGELTEVAKNHEYIHTMQQRELGYIGFLLWYNLEWLYKTIKYRSRMKAYRSLIFEREAYGMQSNLNYSNERRPYEWFYHYTEPGTLAYGFGRILVGMRQMIKRCSR